MSTFETISINFLDSAENSSFYIVVTRNVKMLILNVVYQNQKETLVTLFYNDRGESVIISNVGFNIFKESISKNPDPECSRCHCVFNEVGDGNQEEEKLLLLIVYFKR